MKKILILHQSQAYAGTDVFALNIIDGLKQKGYDVEILLNRDNKDIVNFYNTCKTHVYKHTLLTTYNLNRYQALVKKIFILLFFPFLVLLHLVMLYNQIKKINPDKILIVNAGIPGGLMVYTGAIVCGILNIPTIYTIHNDVVYNKFLKFYLFLIEKIVCSFKNIKFVSVSKYNIKRIKSRSFFLKNIKLVYNGVDCNNYQNINDDINQNNFNIVFIGNISEQKGIKILIKAFEALNSNLNCKLYIYGKVVDISLFDYVKEKSALNSNIELILNEHDKNIIFKNKHLLVLPSTSLESFGQVLIEAMCYGIPVLGSDGLGIKEVMEVDDKLKAGETFELGSSKSLAKKIVKFMNDKELYQYYKKNTIILYKKYFTKEIMIQNYIRLLEGK